MDPLINAECGDVKDMNAKWTTCSQRYSLTGYPGYGETKVAGERFTLSAKMSKTVFFFTWSTDFLGRRFFLRIAVLHIPRLQSSKRRLACKHSPFRADQRDHTPL